MLLVIRLLDGSISRNVAAVSAVFAIFPAVRHKMLKYCYHMHTFYLTFVVAILQIVKVRAEVVRNVLAF